MITKKNGLSFSILVLCAVSVVALNLGGISSRVRAKAFALAADRPRVHLLRTTGGLYALWQERHVHGRVVVHLGKYLHFTDSQLSSGMNGQFFPQISAVARDHQDFRMSPASYRNFLWDAFQENIVRKIYNVIPPSDFAQRFGQENAAGSRQEIIEKFAASDIYDGAQRTFTATLPRITEPVLLNIDASYFGSADARELFDSLMRSGLRSDLVTVCLSEDNPDVTDLERGRLREFLALLSQRAEIIPPTNSLDSPTALK